MGHRGLHGGLLIFLLPDPVGPRDLQQLTGPYIPMAY